MAVMNPIRPPAVAGRFYPADKRVLQQEIDHFLHADGANSGTVSGRIKALIVPHAGYIYSGLTAGVAYRELSSVADDISRVILIGPAHSVGFNGMALSDAEAWLTPLGQVALSSAAMKTARLQHSTFELPQAHVIEHSLEVQLPFLQTLLSDFEILPVVVGSIEPQFVASLLESVWGGDETLIVISSDLSHYLDYEAARSKDQLTVAAIEQLRYQDIPSNSACGAIPIGGLLLQAKRKGLKGKCTDYRNSGDTAGDKSAVVGYGSFLFYA